MQPNPFPFGILNPFLLLNGGQVSKTGFESSRIFFLLPFLLSQQGDMDFSKVGEKILSSVRSARSLGLLPSAPDRPEVPPQAAAAAAVARVLAGLPPHQRYSLPSSSEELRSIYGSNPRGQGHVVEELEEEFHAEDFDPVAFILEHIPSEENELEYFEKQAALRLVQLDGVAEQLSHQVMKHHEVMVKGMHLVREVEKDLQVANVICMNGRRHLSSSANEVSRDLIVNSNSKKKQALLRSIIKTSEMLRSIYRATNLTNLLPDLQWQDILSLLNEIRHALDMQAMLEYLIEEGDYCKAFQVLSEYLQLLDSLSELSAIHEMSSAVEVWLGRTLQKLDSLLLGVCQEFKEEGYVTVVDAYALIGDVSGLAEKMQSFFMQEVLAETHLVLKNIVQEDQEAYMQNSRLTYSDLCLQIPESNFRQCLLKTLAVLFRLMCSYYEIMSFQIENKVSPNQILSASDNIDASSNVREDQEVRELRKDDSVAKSSSKKPGSNGFPSEFIDRTDSLFNSEKSISNISSADPIGYTGSLSVNSHHPVDEARNVSDETSTSDSPWYHLRSDAMAFVSQTLLRGRKNIWQLTTSRLSVLLSSTAVGSTSLHQFLKNYEDLKVFILAGEAFCGVEAVEFRQKLKTVCENYFAAFHRQNVFALKMVLEKESWLTLPSDTIQIISFAGLVGDGAALITQSGSNTSNAKFLHPNKSVSLVDSALKKNGFTNWFKGGNPFLLKLTHGSGEGQSSPSNGATSEDKNNNLGGRLSPKQVDVHDSNGSAIPEDENEDLLADFIDEDSQLPSRIAKPKSGSSHQNNDELTAQTGSSICLLRSMDKYARLMQKLEAVNVEYFKGICQLFGIFFFWVFETFGQQNINPGGRSSSFNTLNYRLRTALSRIMQDCDQWIKPQIGLGLFSSASPTSVNTVFMRADVTPTSPPSSNFGHLQGTSFGLKERCVGVDTISLVAQILHKSKPHLQSILVQKNPAMVEDFYVNLVDSIPDLAVHIHRTTARLLLHTNGYVDRITNAKWEVKELGMEHNGYVDLLLGEFKHYKTRLAHGGIKKEAQDQLLEYGVEIVAETLVEGLSRVKRCTDEGRALMSLDLQVLINGLQHFVSINVKPKLQIVEAFIKAYYLPETEYVHWAHAHPEYTKNQMLGLINLVAAMKGWKRKTRLEILEKIE